MKKALRVLLVVLFMAMGFGIGMVLTTLKFFWTQNPSFLPVLYVTPALIFGAAGFMAAPWIIVNVKRMMIWLENHLQRMPVDDLMAGTIGLITGLIIASLIGVAMARIPFVGNYMSLLACALFGYMGINMGLKKRSELLNFFRRAKFSQKDKQKSDQVIPFAQPASGGKLLDTSVIIDGRIADVCKSGFLEGQLVIPSFVLTELQHIADSSDALKRNRGRRGLDILNTMHKALQRKVRVEEIDFPEITDVDAKLVRLAQVWNFDILTNDYNLNKVAKLHDVRVLNINELANAMKPFLIPGEEFGIRVIREGKESKQGIGYLDDGTMIVIESGKKYIDHTILVVVTSVLQTAAGRMIFAKPKFNDQRVYLEEKSIG
jgi:uncharacterized protein YacL